MIRYAVAWNFSRVPDGLLRRTHEDGKDDQARQHDSPTEILVFRDVVYLFTNSAPFVYPAQMRRCSTSTPGRAAVTGGLTVTLWRPAGSFHPANNGNFQTLYC